MARIRRVDIAESFRRLKHENEKLLEMCAKQRVEMQQQALIREQAAAIREMRDGN
jgi:hypothetical protein